MTANASVKYEMLETHSDVGESPDVGELATKDHAVPAFLRGGGEMGAMMRAYDWQATTLGSPENWSQPLRTAIRILLNTGHPTCIWWGPDLLCFYNDAYRQSLGSERHPGSLGRPAREVWDEIWNVVQPQIDHVMSGGDGVWRKNVLVPVTRNGRREEIYWAYNCVPIDDPSAATGVGGVLIVSIETTEQVLSSRSFAEERPTFTDVALRQSEEQLRLATDAAEVGFWDLDVVTQTLFWPTRVKGMFGISAHLPVCMADFFAGIHPDDRERISAAYAAALDPARRAMYDVEYRAVGKEDGVIRWVAAKGRALFDGDRCVRVIGTAIDISARKAAEAELRELNESLERRVAEALAERKVFVDIVESTDAFIQVLDPNFRILAINRANADAFERAYGFRPKVGDCVLDQFEDRPEQGELIKGFWIRALAGEEFTAVEEFSNAKLGRRSYEMKYSALRDRDGEVVGAFVFVNDVTERLRDQARLAEAERNLRHAQKIDALGQLTGGVAHDFNNLLMVISGGLSLIERISDPQRRRRIIGQMRQAAERGTSLSRQLLAFARRQPLNPEPVDLRRQVDGMRELLDRTLRGDVQVKTELAADLWPIKVDPAELELVVLNLCVNARDAMPGGGVITIGAKNAPQLRDGELSGDFVALTVADTGTGMSAEVFSHIFEPFFTTKEIGRGSGLGLPQVYGFAQQSGGSVNVDSVLGRGTTVTLLLPRSEASPALQASPALDLDGVARRRALLGSILLVEDDDEVAALVTEMFHELGYRVTRTASAQAALGALADDREIDVIFSDVMMPGSMNGMDLAREVSRRRPDVPVLLTTGYAGAVIKTAAAENIEVLCKPYELDALDAALRAALGKTRPS